LVNAARFEAMGRIHLEAMACGKPIIATRTNGATDYIEDGRTGLLCDIDDVDGLAKKLDYLLSHPEAAEKMGHCGREKVERHLSEARYLSSVVSMLEETIDAKDRREARAAL
jgi:glycosyltransferase involved in cell wall biosynthesis